MAHSPSENTSIEEHVQCQNCGNKRKHTFSGSVPEIGTVPLTCPECSGPSRQHRVFNHMRERVQCQNCGNDMSILSLVQLLRMVQFQ